MQQKSLPGFVKFLIALLLFPLLGLATAYLYRINLPVFMGLRLTLEIFPIVLMGILFGPLPGALFGLLAHFAATYSFGYQPILCVAPMLYGIFGGLMRWDISRKTGFWRIFGAYLPAALIGSVLYDGFAGAFLKGGFGNILTMLISMVLHLIQYLGSSLICALITWLLLICGIFRLIRIWPLVHSRTPQPAAQVPAEPQNPPYPPDPAYGSQPYVEEYYAPQPYAPQYDPALYAPDPYAAAEQQVPADPYAYAQSQYAPQDPGAYAYENPQYALQNSGGCAYQDPRYAPQDNGAYAYEDPQYVPQDLSTPNQPDADYWQNPLYPQSSDSRR